MNQKVYVETSIVSYYIGRPSRDLVIAARQQLTREWWEEHQRAFAVYISVLVLEEAGEGDPLAATRRLEALEGVPILGLTTEIEDLATGLVADGPIPENHTEDALHIAIASVNGMDFLLTWNFTHINNAIMKREITKICEGRGYECPILCSPDELVGESS